MTNIIANYLEPLLIAAAIGQIAIALLNLRLDRILKWDIQLANVELLLQEVFQVHKYFITITLLVFGAITIRFAADIGSAAYEMTRWFAAGVGIFWGIRTILQWAFYSSSHWRGDRGRTAVHWILTICYGGCTLTYLYAAFQ